MGVRRAGPDWIRRRAKPLEQQLADLDRLAFAAHHRPRVVTHGGPHPGDILLADDGLLLIDWDTMALAPLERNIWLAVDDDDDLAAYAERSGRTPDLEALALYRLAWTVSDMASYVAELRRPTRGPRIGRTLALSHRTVVLSCSRSTRRAMACGVRIAGHLDSGRMAV